MPNKNDIMDKAAAKNIADLFGLQSQINKDIESDIFGTVSHDINIDATKNKMASLVNNYTQSFGGNFIDSLVNTKSNFTDNERKNLEKIKSAIQDNKNVSMFQNMISNNDTVSSRYEDLVLVSSILPQLKQAKTAIINSILSPDDFTKQIALNMNINGKPLSTVNPNLYKECMNILKKYNYTKLIKFCTDRTVTFGSYNVAVLPYKKLFSELLQKKNGRSTNINGLANENFTLSEGTLLTENMKSVNNLKKDIKNILENVTISNDTSSLFCEEALLQEFNKASKTENKSIFDIDKLTKNVNTKVSKKRNYKMETSHDGTISSSGNDSEDLNITGCKIKKLDPRRLLALQVDEDTCLGYYYFENNETKDLLKNPGMFSFKNGLNNMNAQSTVDSIYKNIGDLLWKKLDHKFIESNAQMKERLYDILKYADVNNDSKLKITFLEADEVVKYEINNGESVFESSLYFSRLYLMVLLSTITARVVRANDVRAYYVDVESDGGVNSMLYNAIDTLQKSNNSILSSNHITKIISNYSVFEDIFIPKSKDEKKPIDFDIISGQNIDMNTDLLELLEQICVNSTGVPLALLQNSNDVDFARTFTMLNIAFMKTSLDRQTDINPSISETLKKILLTELTDEVDVKSIENLECFLQSPMNLLLTNILEQINNAKDVAQAISDVVTGQTGADVYGDKVIDRFMLQICKKYAPNVPWDEFQEILDTLGMDVKKEEVTKTDDTEEV